MTQNATDNPLADGQGAGQRVLAGLRALPPNA